MLLFAVAVPLGVPMEVCNSGLRFHSSHHFGAISCAPCLHVGASQAPPPCLSKPPNSSWDLTSPCFGSRGKSRGRVASETLASDPRAVLGPHLIWASYSTRRSPCTKVTAYHHCTAGYGLCYTGSVGSQHCVLYESWPLVCTEKHHLVRSFLGT